MLFCGRFMRRRYSINFFLNISVACTVVLLVAVAILAMVGYPPVKQSPKFEESTLPYCTQWDSVNMLSNIGPIVSMRLFSYQLHMDE